MKKISLIITVLICFGFQTSITKTDSVVYYTKHNKTFKALNYSRNALTNSLQKNDYNTYCELSLQRSDLFRKLNDPENALKVLYDALQYAEKYNLEKNQIFLYSTIGNIHTDSYNFSKSKKILYKAKSIASLSNKGNLKKKVNQALFRLHMTMESDSAEYYLKEVIAFTKNSKDYKELYSNYNNFYSFYIYKKDYKNAKNAIFEALKYAKLSGDIELINRAYSNLGVYYLEAEVNYEKAIKIYKDNIVSHSESQHSSILSDAYLNLSYAYEKLKDYKRALEYSNKYYEIQDVILDGKIATVAQEIETKYAVNKVEEAYKFKTQELVDKQKRNQKIVYLLIILLVLVGAIFYIYFQNLKLKQKNKLKDLDTELQYKIISATLDGQDQERNKISEVLHDNVSATLSSVGLHLSAFESTLSPEQRNDLKKTRALLKQAHDKVRDLSHELVPPLLVKFGLQFALRDLCENNSNSLIQFTFNSSIPKNKKFHPEFETKVYYFVSELFNNAIKHSDASEVNLILQMMEDNLKIIVSDNGKGFASKDKPLGFGLTQIKARVKNMNGKVTVFSQPNEGTVITIMVKE